MAGPLSQRGELPHVGLQRTGAGGGMNWSAGRRWISLALNELQGSGSGRSQSPGSAQPENSRGQSENKRKAQRAVTLAIIFKSFPNWR